MYYDDPMKVVMWARVRTHTHTHTHTRMGYWGGCWIGSRKVGRGCGRRSGMGSGFVFARRSTRCVRGLPRGSLSIYLSIYRSGNQGHTHAPTLRKYGKSNTSARTHSRVTKVTHTHTPTLEDRRSRVGGSISLPTYIHTTVSTYGTRYRYHSSPCLSSK